MSTTSRSRRRKSEAQAQVGPEEVDVGGRPFDLLKIIGRGAFGVVWYAQEKGTASDPVAVKGVVAKTAKAFAAATFEAELLRLLTARLPVSCWERVPRYITHSTLRSSGGGTVRLAMTFVPGSPLDQWIYGITDEEHKQVDASFLVEGRLPASRQRRMRLSAAVSFSANLLSQLSGVFNVLQSIAYHRDVSSHNVLVDVQGDISEQGEAPSAKFALIDFGLAVRSGSWNRDWCTSNLAGDPRYWAPAAWMAFAFGFRYVEAHPDPGFHRQYLSRIDHYSLGVLGLETLFSLWDYEHEADAGVPGMREARDAWCQFWYASIRLFQMFHLKGSQEVRKYIARSPEDGIVGVVTHLKHLRQALRHAASQPGNSAVAPLLVVLADLVDDRGSMNWPDLPCALSEERRGMSTDFLQASAAWSNLVGATKSMPGTANRRDDRSPARAGTPGAVTPKRITNPTQSSWRCRSLTPHHRTGGAAVANDVPRGPPSIAMGSSDGVDKLSSTWYDLRAGCASPRPKVHSYVAPAQPMPPVTHHTAHSGGRSPAGRMEGDAARSSEESRQLPSWALSSVPYMPPAREGRKQSRPHSYVPPAKPSGENRSYVPQPEKTPSYVPLPQQSSSYVPLPVASPTGPAPSCTLSWQSLGHSPVQASSPVTTVCYTPFFTEAR